MNRINIVPKKEYTPVERDFKLTINQNIGCKSQDFDAQTVRIDCISQVNKVHLQEEKKKKRNKVNTRSS